MVFRLQRNGFRIEFNGFFVILLLELGVALVFEAHGGGLGFGVGGGAVGSRAVGMGIVRRFFVMLILFVFVGRALRGILGGRTASLLLTATFTFLGHDTVLGEALTKSNANVLLRGYAAPPCSKKKKNCKKLEL